MQLIKMKTVSKKLALLLGAPALVVALFSGCAQIQDFIFPAPNVPGEWNALLTEVRAFERRIGFQETANFKTLYNAEAKSETQSEYPMCSYAPRFQLPYSYEDPLVRWGDAQNDADCRAAAKGEDVYFTMVEALGEIGTAVTATMLEGKLDRFLYLVIHEDCHDQFDLPYGVEEALCNVLGYKGMAAFTEQKYSGRAREGRAIRRYAETQSQLTRAVVAYYRQVEQLYARHARQEIAAEAVLIERARIFGGAERTFGWKRQAMNNAGLANEMTYSRHYQRLEAAHERLGNDLQKTVAFFKQVDKLKPTRAAVMKQHRISDEKSVEFVRIYEAAVMETVDRLLANATGNAHPGGLK